MSSGEIRAARGGVAVEVVEPVLPLVEAVARGTVLRRNDPGAVAFRVAVRVEVNVRRGIGWNEFDILRVGPGLLVNVGERRVTLRGLTARRVAGDYDPLEVREVPVAQQLDEIVQHRVGTDAAGRAAFAE